MKCDFSSEIYSVSIWVFSTGFTQNNCVQTFLKTLTMILTTIYMLCESQQFLYFTVLFTVFFSKLYQFYTALRFYSCGLWLRLRFLLRSEGRPNSTIKMIEKFNRTLKNIIFMDGYTFYPPPTQVKTPERDLYYSPYATTKIP